MYGKVFTSLFEGTLRGRLHEIVVFVNMIAHADKEGFVDMHPRAIADEVGLSEEEARSALDSLEQPDPESRSSEEGGRRIIRVSDHRTWGWQIVNYVKYATLRDQEERRAQTRESMRRLRARRRAEA